LDAVHEAATREDKSKVLADNDCLALRDVLKVNFDDDLKIYVSKNVNWEPQDVQKVNLKDVTKFLVPLAKPEVDRKRADASFKAMLEQIHPADAMYLEQAVYKRLKIKGLTEKLIKGVWGNRIL
jgi:hypothetical protein